MLSVFVLLGLVVGQTLGACDGGGLPDLGSDGEDANNEYYQSLSSSHPFSVRDLVRADRLSGGKTSPDGTTVAFFRYVWNVELNASSTTLWVADLASGSASRVTPFAWGLSEFNAQWTSDSSRIVFLSNRGGSGTQVWAVSPTGDDLRQVTDYPLSVQTMALDGNNVAFSVSIFPGTTMDQTCNYLAAKEEGTIPGYGKLDAFLYTKTFVRHWDTWFQARRNHVFLTTMSVSGGQVTFAEPRDIMMEWDVDVPTKPYGDMNEWSFSADGKVFAFSRQMSCDDSGVCDLTEEKSDVTWKTNLDICFVSTAPGDTPNCVTNNPAIDTEPRFHPTNPELLSYVRTTVPGYESSQREIYLWNISSGVHWRAVDQSFDFSVGEHTWSSDGTKIIFNAIVDGVNQVYYTEGSQQYPTGVNTDQDHPLSCGGLDPFGEQVLLACSSLYRPVEFFVASLGGSAVSQLTVFNTDLLAKVQMGTEAQYLKYSGADGDEVGMWVLTPYDYQPTGSYGVAMLIHGGPQSAWTTDWSYRWNPQMYAGEGYFSVMINFHGSMGSTGNLSGQAFIDSITKNWGGRPFIDIHMGLDYVLTESAYAGSLDAERAVAAGASYGGYMIGWIAGHMDEVMASGKNSGFKALFWHDGMFNTRAFAYDTEELWFPEHDFGGPEYQDPSNYELYNPANFVSNWNTPMIIAQGGKDFRLSTNHGISMFNALQRRGIDSELMYFPTQNHWITGPTELTAWMTWALNFLNRYGNP
eukprot:CAMPEP_0119119272 /NCGR_PEP_ID=MMETSP1310-20130426/825_1 /TAXON_ID=464262 /ORGANISM="Genus nov. species nov., Strain RCC2339" /LENGTH=748 /DNA_ID=CAMNT_0007108693 /DNA_START=172 /DNA_END=2418 /DNA_ORIENTATION=-